MSASQVKLIYAIDDDGLVRVFLEHALAPGGYVVEAFSNAPSLIAAAQKRAPTLFVIDIRMPDTSGEELVSTLRLSQTAKRRRF